MVVLKNKIIFGENGRSIGTFYSKKLEEIEEYVKAGWAYQIDYCGNGYWLRAPDEWIVDLADPFKASYYGNHVINYEYFKFLKKLKKEKRLEEYIKFVISKRKTFYKNFEFAISNGIILDTEIRILGNDKRLKVLKMELFKNFYLFEFDKSSYKFKNYKNCVELSSKDCKEVKDFINKTKEYNKIINNEVNISNYIINEKILLPQYDYLLLVPNGGYKYLKTFLTKDNYDRIIFYEKHVNSHVKSNITLYDRDLTNKDVLIIDTLYSGKTLSILKKEIEKRSAKVKTLGLFPKSMKFGNDVDYIMILNKILQKKDFDKYNSIENLYNEIINGVF